MKIIFCNIIVWVVFSICGFLQSKGAQSPANPYQNIDKEAIVGRDSILEDANFKSDVIFAGKIMHLGPILISAHGEVTCLANNVQVSKVFKGVLGDAIDVDFKIRSSLKEKKPEVKALYIFFVKRCSDDSSYSYTLFKLVPATDENISEIKALIAAAPASK